MRVPDGSITLCRFRQNKPSINIVIKHFITFSVLLGCAPSILAQSSGGGSTKAISNEESAENADEVVGYCGFRETYFSKEDFAGILDDSQAVGVRFYIGREDKKQYHTDIIAVATDSSGNELNEYVLSKVYAENTNMPSSIKSKDYCQTCVNNLASSFAPYTSYYESSILYDLLNVKGATGIRVRSSGIEVGKYEIVKTMSIGVVKLKESGLIDKGSSYLQDLEPCPAQCGSSGGKYLFDTSRWVK